MATQNQLVEAARLMNELDAVDLVIFGEEGFVTADVSKAAWDKAEILEAQLEALGLSEEELEQAADIADM